MVLPLESGRGFKIVYKAKMKKTVPTVVEGSASAPAETKSAKAWPLAVHIVYAGASPKTSLQNQPNPTEAFAANLYSRLSSGDRAARVPVRLWRSQVRNTSAGMKARTDSASYPQRIPLEHAARNLVVVLVDQNLFEKRADWDKCIKTLVREAKSEKDIIIPVAINADAARVAKSFGDVNHIRVHDPARLVEDERIYQSIYTALLRLLVGELPMVFLCHAKADGALISQNVRQYIYEQTQLTCFFDTHDIPHGKGVKKSILSSIQKSVILAVWTDHLLDSPWCQFEIIESRRLQRPILVLDALSEKTPRLFPFLGNMPVVRWQNDPALVVSEMLLELIRTHHLAVVFGSLAEREQEKPSFGLHPPDLLDSSLTSMSATPSAGLGLAMRSRPAHFVYPDPPLKPGELDILHRILPGKYFISLVEWQALRAADALDGKWNRREDLRPNPLRRMRIGISVSASETWTEIGLIAQHQDDIAENLALQLILLGAKVVWGGDLRPDGFGRQLKMVVQTYQHPAHPPQDHVGMYSPFSLDPSRSLDVNALEARRVFAEVKTMGCPVQGEVLPLASSADGRALVALGLSLMRVEIAEKCDARILLGGGLSTFQGIYPGIAEEAYETIKAKRPIYIIGGFGGAARAVYEAIASRNSHGATELLRASCRAGAAATDAVRLAHSRYVEKAKRPEVGFDPEAMVDAFSQFGLAGLAKSNGLSESDNERLSYTQDIHEILELIVKGVTIVRSRSD